MLFMPGRAAHTAAATNTMKRTQPPGDTPPEEFRKQLHDVADWIANFRENIESLRVAPNEKPGAVRAQLRAQPPENGEPFEKAK